MINKKVAIVILGTACLLGCNKTEQGAMQGAIFGGLVGQAIGGDTEGTLIGVGAGALLGGAIGNDQDKQYQQPQYNRNGTTRRSSRQTTVLNPDGTYSTTGTETTVSEETTGGYEGLPQ